MNRKKKAILTGAVLVCVAGAIWMKVQNNGEYVRIACVGDSITYGAYLENRRENCYPAVLQKLLGSDYRVKNFGSNGRTVQESGDRPYRAQKKYKASLDFAPDVVLLMLGTNDTKPENWKGIEAFKADYKELLESYEKLPLKPNIILLTPSAAFEEGLEIRDYEIVNERIEQEREFIQELGEEKNLQVIDIYKLTKGNPQWYRLDGVHPDADGAKAIAECVRAQIEREAE